MKQLLAFSILLLHLFGSVSFAKAKEHSRLPTKKTSTGPAFSAMGLHHTDAAELTHSLLVSFSVHKIREPRPVSALLRCEVMTEPAAIPFRRAAIEHLSLPYLSLLRLLLFPKHYFW